jgi:hypothetical protein
VEEAPAVAAAAAALTASSPSALKRFGPGMRRDSNQRKTVSFGEHSPVIVFNEPTPPSSAREPGPRGRRLGFIAQTPLVPRPPMFRGDPSASPPASPPTEVGVSVAIDIDGPDPAELPPPAPDESASDDSQEAAQDSSSRFAADDVSVAVSGSLKRLSHRVRRLAEADRGLSEDSPAAAPHEHVIVDLRMPLGLEVESAPIRPMYESAGTHLSLEVPLPARDRYGSVMSVSSNDLSSAAESPVGGAMTPSHRSEVRPRNYQPTLLRSENEVIEIEYCVSISAWSSVSFCALAVAYSVMGVR